MKRVLKTCVAAAALTWGMGQALAAGELHIYNWGNYTNPELIENFEKAHDIKVTLDGYDSNETMLAKVKPGGSTDSLTESTIHILTNREHNPQTD